MSKMETREEYLKRCEEYRDERIQLEAWKRYESGIVVASRKGAAFLEPKESAKFNYFGVGKYKS